MLTLKFKWLTSDFFFLAKHCIAYKLRSAEGRREGIGKNRRDETYPKMVTGPGIKMLSAPQVSKA